MSKAWATGSTRTWRKLRRAVLDRDGHRCQIQGPGCTTHATEAHHTHGRAATGDNPEYLESACSTCNKRIGHPTADPQPEPRTRW